MRRFDKISILVVDNSAMMRSIMREVLSQLPRPEIKMAASAAEAREQTKKHRFDIIVLDYFLGEEDGGDFAKALRRDSENINRRVPILMITAMPNHRKVLKAYESGINAILAKPIKIKSLYMRIHAMLTNPQPFVETESYIGPSRENCRILKDDLPQDMREMIISGVGKSVVNQGEELFLDSAMYHPKHRTKYDTLSKDDFVHMTN